MKTNLFLEKSIQEIRQCYASGSLGVSDVAEECIAQYKAHEPTVCAYEDFDENLLRASFRKIRMPASLDQMRPLEGIPFGVKDVFNTRDYHTQMGSPLWKGFTAGNDARTVHNCLQAGGVISGKTVTAEFAVHTLLNKTVNPHDHSRTPGTSSSGSAVAVAMGMVPFALGTQTAGSIIRPASFCGVYGFKPSFGLVPRTGVLKTTDPLDTIGFLTTHCANLRPVFETIRVKGANYPISNAVLRDTTRQRHVHDRPWKVAFVRTYTWPEAPSYAQDAITTYVDKFSNVGCDVTELSLPAVFTQCHEVHETIYDKSLSYYFQHEFGKNEHISAMMKEMIEKGLSISDEAFLTALCTQSALIESFDAVVREYDVILSLSTAGEAPLRGITENRDPSLIWTFLHLPVISAPVFKSPSGLPFGLQLVGRKYNDLLLLQFAEWLCDNGFIPKRCLPPC
ncbi:amidase, Asp-tRNAAsn/Glu-tRNAGln amidotransferase A subunit [Desulfocurvibacter africanus PCS]|uniref:Amidase, Asp-tRNAAsn/Glu-tRNAGln amidotransferase A subunit n=1 Tax=Desulfocurvibacter africanus PCS TaxID=1262666 RepID=M5Q3G6_DESAF|nr:amidase [Desulfocurvibacter africanus]EMG38413.1 amidase, Asp-tRNAAsn/Glu-tRNAGln amidotransferase A subunit [Desulfocurvibacter africanus PCS]